MSGVNQGAYNTLRAKVANGSAVPQDIANWLQGTSWDDKGIIATPINSQIIGMLNAAIGGTPLAQNVIVDDSGITIYLGQPGQPPVENFPTATSVSGGGGLLTPFQGAAGAAANVLSEADALKKLLNWISDPIRMGELIVGVIVVGLGINAMLKGALGKNAPQIPGPKVQYKPPSAPKTVTSASENSKILKAIAKEPIK